MKNLLTPQRRYHFWKDIAWISVIVLVTVILGVSAKQNQMVVNATELVYVTPTPTPYVQPELAGLKDQKRARAIIKKTWKKDFKVGLAIAICESGLRESVIGVSRDIGLFQVNPIHGFANEDMQNGVANAIYAYTLYKEQSVQPWESSRSCWEEKI